jgi:DNA-directed RNA polymerase subunit RPC12/RpoP
MDYTLQIFKHGTRAGWAYRFAVVDKSKTYPANFVCMLPLKLVQTKADQSYGGMFGSFFGDKSVDVAVKLLNDALKTEKEADIRAEIEKRLKLVDPKQVNVVKCSECKKEFQQQKTKKYKRYLCEKCLTQRNKRKYHANV